MAIWTANGTFNTGTGAPGNLSAITGLPGTPQRIRFTAISKATAGQVAGVCIMTGVAVSATSRFALSRAMEDNVNPSSTGDTARNVAVLVEVLLSGGVNLATEGGYLDVASFDANGFTPAIDATFTTDTLVCWHAVGGGTAITIKEAISNASGAQQYTAVGCTPSFVEVFTAHKATANTGINNQAFFSYGFGDGTNNYCVAGYTRDNQSGLSDSRSILLTANVADEPSSAGDTTTISWASLTLSGTAVTISRSTGTAAHCLYLVCYEGYTCQMGTTPAFNDTSDHVLTTTGVNPLEVTLVARPNVTTGGTMTAHDELAFGFASKNTGTIGVSGFWVGVREANPVDANAVVRTNRTFENRLVTSAAAVTLEGDATIVALGYERWTWDQVTADATVPLVLYWALGSAPAVGVTTAPSGATDGVDFSTQPVLQLKDASGNNTSDTTNVVATIVAGTGTLSGTATKAAVAGVATFTNLRITGATGSHTVRFTAGSAYVDSTFSVASAVVTATKLIITVQPVSTIVGQTMANITVTATDNAGVVSVAYVTACVLAWLNNPSVAPAPAGTLSKAMTAGVVVFNNIVVNTLQTAATFRFTSGALTVADSSAFNITATPPGGSHIDGGHIAWGT